MISIHCKKYACYEWSDFREKRGWTPDEAVQKSCDLRLALMDKYRDDVITENRLDNPFMRKLARKVIMNDIDRRSAIAIKRRCERNL